MKARVLITDKLDETGINILKQVAEVDYKTDLSPQDLINIISEYDALLVRSQTQVTKELINASRLKIIGRAGVGVDNIDVEAATEKGIIVVNSPEGNTIAAAEHTIALIFGLCRQIALADFSCKSNKWERSKFIGTELNGHNLGIIGLGKIGQRVGKIALASGMKILAYDPFISQEKIENMGFKKMDLESIFRQADFITLHVPKTKETHNLINKDSISMMKNGVRIINCARGGLVNEKDLAQAILSGKVAGAAFDVFENEPCLNSALHECSDKVLLTPHLGASTSQAQLNVAIDVAEQIRDVLQGGVARSAVNLPGLKPELITQIKPYLGLAEIMGSLIAQITNGAIKSIEIEAHGKLGDKNIEGLKLAILKGILGLNLDGVTFVNAPLIAGERGIKVLEQKSELCQSYIDLLKIQLITDKGSHTIAGTVFQDNIPAIVQIDDFALSWRPERHSLLTFHKDQPGIVAQVSKILWDKQINISGMSLGLTKDESQAVMIIGVNREVDDDSLAHIESIHGIDNAHYIKLKGKI